MAIWSLREKIAIEGNNPERALYKLHQAGVTLFNVKKTQKTQIVFSVDKKDTEKVFAIYPKMCYNVNDYAPYHARSLRAEGLVKFVSFCKKRSLFLAGAILFCACTLFADSLVFGVRIVGSQSYKREVYIALEEHGVKPFTRYDGKETDIICSQLLSLQGVEFCSVKKEGLYVRVEIRVDHTPINKFAQGDMVSKRTGEITAITALRGTPLKKKGDKVFVGETLVGGWFTPTDGERVRVEPIACVKIACVYEEIISADSEESAFAQAYLALNLSDDDTITKREINARQHDFLVRIEYTAVEKINF